MPRGKCGSLRRLPWDAIRRLRELCKSQGRQCACYRRRIVILGFPGILDASKFSSAIFADLLKRGIAISFLTLACVVLLIVFLAFLRGMRPPRNCKINEEVTIRMDANGFRPNDLNKPRQRIRRTKLGALLYRLLTIQMTKHTTMRVPINPYPNMIIS